MQKSARTASQAGQSAMLLIQVERRRPGKGGKRRPTAPPKSPLFFFFVCPKSLTIINDQRERNRLDSRSNPSKITKLFLHREDDGAPRPAGLQKETSPFLFVYPTSLAIMNDQRERNRDDSSGNTLKAMRNCGGGGPKSGAAVATD